MSDESPVRGITTWGQNIAKALAEGIEQSEPIVRKHAQALPVAVRPCPERCECRCHR